MGKTPTLKEKFKDRGLQYTQIVASKYAAVYEYTSIGESLEDGDAFIGFDVFRFSDLAPLEEDCMALYPTDVEVIFGDECKGYSGKRAFRNDLLQEALVQFKIFGYFYTK